jgi:hypothetical protein
MIGMASQTGGRADTGGWAEALRRLAAAPQAPAAVALLGPAAVTEASVRAAVIGATAQTALALCLLALASTLPLAVLGRVPAAVAVCAVSVLSLAAFHALTVAGLLAQLIVLYRLGEVRRLGPALAMTFPVLALADPAGGEAGLLTVLLAGLAPTAAWAGAAGLWRRTRRVPDRARGADQRPPPRPGRRHRRGPALHRRHPAPAYPRQRAGPADHAAARRARAARHARACRRRRRPAAHRLRGRRRLRRRRRPAGLPE